MSPRQLPTLPACSAPTDPACPGCSRRELLAGLGLATAASLLGCGGGAGDAPAPDAAVPVGFAMCGANVCVDLNDDSNAALREVGGQRGIDVPARLLVVRTSASELVVLSRVCTHASCSVGYSAATTLIQCPCHGSRFELTGAVERGPASEPLRRYTTMFDAATQRLTIVL